MVWCLACRVALMCTIASNFIITEYTEDTKLSDGRTNGGIYNNQSMSLHFYHEWNALQSPSSHRTGLQLDLLPLMPAQGIRAMYTSIYLPLMSIRARVYIALIPWAGLTDISGKPAPFARNVSGGLLTDTTYMPWPTIPNPTTLQLDQGHKIWHILWFLISLSNTK